MSKILMLVLILLPGCASIKCFSIDGKASLSCKRGELAKEYCPDGVKNYDYFGVECKR